MSDTFTNEEKIKLLMGKNGWQLEDLDGRLPTVSLSDGPVGVRKSGTTDWDENAWKIKDLPSIAYPSIEVLSQTWNLDLAKTLGECLADDCIEKDIDVLLAPGVNIKRSPICGRNFEYFSEDPYLAGQLAKAYIEGLQSHHIGATLKHYLANNNEVGRMWASSNVDERTLREIYMRPFEIALEAKPWAVMSSYNLLNGVRLSENKDYIDILRNELGHEDRLVMSDWDAVKDHTASVIAGTDLEMPFNKEHYQKLLDDYRNNLVDHNVIDKCSSRVLSFINHNENEKKLRKVSRSVEERLAIARKIEEEGIVLLKNDGVLPIRNGQSIAVTQEDFTRYYSGKGSSNVIPTKTPRLVQDALRALLNKSEIVSSSVWGSGDSYARCFTNVDNKDISIVLVGFEMSEGNDRRNYSLKNYDNEDWFIKTLAKRNKNTVVVLYGGAAVSVKEWIDDVAALVYVGYAGEEGSEAIANILTGKVNPSGKLTETFANELNDYPSENIDFDGLNYNYLEKMDVGYRYFDKYPSKIRFPFGYGLSYTKYEYSNLKVHLNDEDVIVEYDIKNIGEYDGSEISEIYVKPINSKIEKPIKELRGFNKSFIKKNKKKHIQVILDHRAFSHYDVLAHKWARDLGEYEILVGDSSINILLKEKIIIEK